MHLELLLFWYKTRKDYLADCKECLQTGNALLISVLKSPVLPKLATHNWSSFHDGLLPRKQACYMKLKVSLCLKSYLLVDTSLDILP